MKKKPDATLTEEEMLTLHARGLARWAGSAAADGSSHGLLASRLRDVAATLTKLVDAVADPSVRFTRAEALRLYMAGLNGINEDEQNAQAIACYERAMSKLAKAYGFFDHYPKRTAPKS
jgi:hypothetical protein